MTANTTSPSSARPMADTRKFAIAIRYAALRRQLRSIAEPVSYSADRFDRVRFSTFVQFGAKPADMRLDNVRLGIKMIIPDALEQHGPGHDFAGVPHQLLEQPELPWLQQDVPAVTGDLALPEVQLNSPMLHAQHLALKRPAAGKGIHSCSE